MKTHKTHVTFIYYDLLLLNVVCNESYMFFQTDDDLYFMTGLELKLSLDAINSWFQTDYR